MPSVLQFRRGTTAQNNSFTGAAGEISVDTDVKTLRVHDGSTAGGSAVVSETGTQTLTNKTLTSPNLTSPTISGTGIAEYIADTVGAMVTSNTESGISVTYQDADNTLDFDVGDFTITLGGDLSGSATITNLGNATLTATIAANSVALGTDTTGNYVASITNGSYITGGDGGSEGAGLTLAVDATTTNTASKVVARDGSGNFAAGTITATLSGNASTATALATARTIGGVSFDGTANISLPGVNTSGNQDTSGNAATATALATARTIGGVSFNGTANINLPGVNTSGNQDTSGNAATATTATNVTVTNNTAENATLYPTFVDGTSGAQGIEIDNTGLTYNPSTNTLTTTNFNGQSTTAKYADLAENYLADGVYAIGTVLQIGGDAEVTVANNTSHAIVGTVSENPGYLMNSALEGEFVTPVAYIGRVPCRVIGTVNRGDLLAVSDIPGVAVAKTPGEIQTGQLVGKALENHSDDDYSNEGLIEILVGRL